MGWSLRGLLLAAGIIGAGFAIGSVPFLIPHMSPKLFAFFVVVCGIVCFLNQYIAIHMGNKLKKIQQREKEREMQKKLQQEREEKEKIIHEKEEMESKERLKKEEQGTMEQTRFKNDLKTCFEEVRDKLVRCCREVEVEIRKTDDDLDVSEMRSKFNLLKQDIQVTLTNLSSTYRERKKVIAESFGLFNQLNVVAIFQKETKSKARELEVFKNRLEQIRTSYGATPFGRLARKIKSLSTLIRKKNGLQLYKLPVELIFSDATNKFKLYELGRENPSKQNKLIMMAGMTGAGKTLLINNIINYVYGVIYNDTFRFQLILGEEEIKEQGMDTSTNKAESMTMWINIFVLHHQEGFRINHSLTIIDTAGFGDTRGIEYDEKIVNQLHRFFGSENPCPVKELCCIGLVIQAGQGRITKEQKNTFDQILNIFGKEIKDNIFALFTFADAQAPPALEVVKKNKIPFNEQATFKFNNSALYAPDYDAYTESSWVFCYKSLENFFRYLGTVTPKNLAVTKDLLERRDDLKCLFESLQLQIEKGMDMLESIKKIITEILALKGTVRANKKYTIKVKRYPRIFADHNATDYDHCISTSCFDSGYITRGNEMSCSPTTAGNRSENCLWQSHSNKDRKFVYEETNVEITIEEMMERYQITMNDKEGKEKLLAKIHKEFRVYRQGTFEDLCSASYVAKSLEEIAFNRSSLTTMTYIERLIESEETSSLPNKNTRLEHLHDFREMALALHLQTVLL